MQVQVKLLKYCILTENSGGLKSIDIHFATGVKGREIQQNACPINLFSGRQYRNRAGI